MSNTRPAYLSYLVPLFVTTILLVVVGQIQTKPTLAVETCFPIEEGSETLICREGPENDGGQEENSTSIKKGTMSSTIKETCFPIEEGSETLICREGPESGVGPENDGGQEENSTSTEG